MNKRLLKMVSRVVPVLLLPCLALGEEYLLYEPKPAAGPEATDKGVLVKSVTVQRGDTLKRIARRYIGKEWLFPQVLLFNKVRNPDLIYPGDKLYVPIFGAKGAEGKAKVEQRKHARGKAKHLRHRKAAHKRRAGVKVSLPAAAPETAAPPQPILAPAPVPAPPVEKKKESRKSARRSKAAASSARPAGDAQALYESARKAYLQGNYRRAAVLFTDFIKEYPDSPVAADASLYRADCYLQLSQQ